MNTTLASRSRGCSGRCAWGTPPNSLPLGVTGPQDYACSPQDAALPPPRVCATGKSRSLLTVESDPPSVRRQPTRNTSLASQSVRTTVCDIRSPPRTVHGNSATSSTQPWQLAFTSSSFSRPAIKHDSPSPSPSSPPPPPPPTPRPRDPGVIPTRHPSGRGRRRQRCSYPIRAGQP